MFCAVLCAESCAQSQAHLDEQFLQLSGLGFVSLGPFTVPRFIRVCVRVFCVILSYCICVVLL